MEQPASVIVRATAGVFKDSIVNVPVRPDHGRGRTVRRNCRQAAPGIEQLNVRNRRKRGGIQRRQISRAKLSAIQEVAT